MNIYNNTYHSIIIEMKSDGELVMDIEESKKDFGEGRYYTLKTDDEIKQFFSDLE